MSTETYRRLDGKPSVNASRLRRAMMITTPDGPVLGKEGDWLITIAHGKHIGDMYVCKEDVFREKFVLAEPPGNR